MHMDIEETPRKSEVTETDKAPQIIEVHGERVGFPYGLVEHVHHIGEYTIVEYSTSAGHLAFSAYVGTQLLWGISGAIVYDGLDHALAAAIAFSHEGVVSDASRYFMNMIGAVTVEGIAE